MTSCTHVCLQSMFGAKMFKLQMHISPDRQIGIERKRGREADWKKTTWEGWHKSGLILDWTVYDIHPLLWNQTCQISFNQHFFFLWWESHMIPLMRVSISFYLTFHIIKRKLRTSVSAKAICTLKVTKEEMYSDVWAECNRTSEGRDRRVTQTNKLVPFTQVGGGVDLPLWL